jgi:hypothetical protein
MSRNKVVVEEGVVRIITVGIQGPPGATGVGADTAYVDAGDAASRARANHTGTQPASTISDFATAADARIGIQKGVANGLATLGSDNKVPSAQLPAIAITDTFPVASQAAMLALTAEVGDIAVRTDLNKSFILRTAGASTLANWQELLSPTDAVTSVNGQTGAVSLTASGLGALVAANNLSDLANAATARTNLGAAAAVHTHAESEVVGLVADLAAKEPTISAGTTSQYWRGDKSWQTLDKTAVGLGNVDNTSDVNKPISTATQSALDDKQPLSDNLTGVANMSGATSGLVALVGGNAYGRTITAGSSKVSVSNGNGTSNDPTIDVVPANFTGIPQSGVTNLTSDLAAKAPLASPALTGTPTAPTATPLTSNTQIATTAYADAAVFAARIDQLTAPSANVNLNGQRIYNLADPTGDQDGATKAYVDAAASAGGSAASFAVAQTAHGFVVGDVLKNSGTANTYAKAQADSAANAEVVGIVTSVTNANNFVLTTQGLVTAGVPALSAGTVVFLSATTAGALTDTEPTGIGEVSKPLGIILESSVKLALYNFRGELLVDPLTAGSPLTVQEADGTPSVANVTTIKVTNGTLTDNGSGVVTIDTGAGGGSGDVVGPSSSTDNALVRFDSTTGKLVQGSGAILDDSNNISGLGAISAGAITSTGASSFGSLTLTTDLAVTEGGTGAGTPIGARSNLGAAAKTIVVVGTTYGGGDGIGDFVCDGAADDVQIQAAIDSLTAGGEVFIKKGTYDISATIILGLDVKLNGEGYGSLLKLSVDGGTLLKFATGGTGILPLVTHNEIHNIRFESVVGLTNCIAIDANAYTQDFMLKGNWFRHWDTGSTAIYLGGTNKKVQILGNYFGSYNYNATDSGPVYKCISMSTVGDLQVVE